MLIEKGDLSKGIKLIDFGISGKVQLSLEQHKAGTLRYCPPELVAGEYFKADPSFDVWSMGVLMYRMLFGEFPFSGPDWKSTKNAIIKARLRFPKASVDNAQL
jgi:serine/threonine protein kinase